MLVLCVGAGWSLTSLPKAQDVRRRKSTSLHLGRSCPQPWSAVSLSVNQAVYGRFPCAPPHLPLALLPQVVILIPLQARSFSTLWQQPALLHPHRNTDTCRGTCIGTLCILVGMVSSWTLLLSCASFSAWWARLKQGSIPGWGAGETLGDFPLAARWRGCAWKHGRDLWAQFCQTLVIPQKFIIMSRSTRQDHTCVPFQLSVVGHYFLPCDLAVNGFYFLSLPV